LKYSKATNYALHTIVYLIEHENEKLSVLKLSEHFKVSVTYLSKILSQLVKAGLIESTSGVNGGYKLSQKMDEISFMDVINAIEGNGALFTCEFQESKCLIHKVMIEAESRMEKYLQEKKLYEIAQPENQFSVERMISMLEERDMISPIDKECDKFDIHKGNIVIDYGCGSGGYTKRVSELIGDEGKVYAVDIQELAIAAVKKKIVQYQLKNIEPILVKNIKQIKDHVADIIIAIDMFHMVQDTNLFLQALHILLKNNGYLFIDVYHMTLDEAREKIANSRLWEIKDEIGNCLKCSPK
jgi:Rrf2 family protein